MTSISEVAICNIALTRLDAKRIVSLTDEDSPNSRRCLALYDHTRDATLADHPWTFAQKRFALGTLEEDPVWTDDGVTVVYQKPPDMLKLNFTNIEFALVKMEGDKILSDTAELKVKYTFRAVDPQKYTPGFVQAFGARLAIDLAYPITHSRTLAADLKVQYFEKDLPEAISIDSQQGTPLQPLQDEWLGSRRLGGSGAIIGRTGWDTWFPVSFR